MNVTGLWRWSRVRDERVRTASKILLLIMLVLPTRITAEDGATPQGNVVRVERSEKSFRLFKNGEPYFIEGAGWVNGDLRTLKEAGGNSIRTWGSDDLGSILDRAHTLGLTVTAGIWLGQVGQGTHYDDPQVLAAHRALVREVVLKHKDHPALLIWGLGNEMELGGKEPPQLWEHLNELARMVKQLDPNHPTMTAVAGINKTKIERLNRLCPDLDLLGVNTYGPIAKIAGQLRDWEWRRPYIVAEFGPPGWWESEKTPWGAPLEATSAQKAETYLTGYLQAVASHRDRCLGSYVFLWGHKQEGTATWFGMLLPGGERLGAVEAMTFAWTGRWPANLAPRALFIETEAAGREVPMATEMDAVVAAYDLDNDPLKFHWEVIEEDKPGNAGKPPLSHPEAIVAVEGNRLRYRTPEAEGAYRLFVTVLDGQGHAATANIPFRVKARTTPR